jgi:hypothetical protein
VAYHARALDDKVAEIYRFYIVPASNIRRSGMSRADSTNVCYDPHPVAPRDHLALRVAPGSRATNARRVATLDRILPLAREYTEANCDQEQHKEGNDRHAFGWQDAVCAVSLGVGCFTRLRLRARPCVLRADKYQYRTSQICYSNLAAIPKN